MKISKQIFKNIINQLNIMEFQKLIYMYQVEVSEDTRGT